MHDQDKNILEKYNILCVTVTAKKAFIEVLYLQRDVGRSVTEVRGGKMKSG